MHGLKHSTMLFRKMSLPLHDRWTLSLKNKAGLSKWMSGWRTIPPFMKQAMTLFSHFRDRSIFLGSADPHRRRWVTAEKMMVICGCCRWRSQRSCFISAARSTLLTFPRSFPPQWMSRTSGADLPRRDWAKKGRTPRHLSPPQPNHFTWALSPRSQPRDFLAASSPRRT